MGAGAGDALDSARIVVAIVDIPARREARWDYDHTHRVGRVPRGDASTGHSGITAAELDSPGYAAAVWTIADDAAMPRADVDFPYAAVGELGLRITVMRGREVVAEIRRRGRGRKRRHGESAMAADED